MGIGTYYLGFISSGEITKKMEGYCQREKEEVG